MGFPRGGQVTAILLTPCPLMPTETGGGEGGCAQSRGPPPQLGLCLDSCDLQLTLSHLVHLPLSHVWLCSPQLEPSGLSGTGGCVARRPLWGVWRAPRCCATRTGGGPLGRIRALTLKVCSHPSPSLLPVSGAVTALNDSPGSRRKPALSGTRHSPWELWALKLGHGHGSHLFTSCQRGSKVGHTVAWAPRMGEWVQRKVRCVFLLQARPGGLGTLCGVLPSACPLPCLTSLTAFALVWGQCGAWAPLPLAPVLGAVGPSR